MFLLETTSAARSNEKQLFRRLQTSALFSICNDVMENKKLIKDVLNVIGHFHDNVFLPLRTGIQIRFSLEFQFRNPSDV